MKLAALHAAPDSPYHIGFKQPRTKKYLSRILLSATGLICDRPITLSATRLYRSTFMAKIRMSFNGDPLMQVIVTERYSKFRFQDITSGPLSILTKISQVLSHRAYARTCGNIRMYCKICKYAISKSTSNYQHCFYDIRDLYKFIFIIMRCLETVNANINAVVYGTV